MRTFLLITGLASLIFTACTSTYQAAVPFDDVYYSSKDQITTAQPAPKVPAAATPASPSTSAKAQEKVNSKDENTEYSGGQYIPQDNQPSEPAETYTNPDGNTNINNYYYDEYDPDNYYDYAYSSRLRRFHNHYCCNNYWDDYYTNRYWYTYNPWDWGISIYWGYNWLWPSWGFYYNFWDPWYYSSWGWGYPYYGWGGNYWNSYYYGYWDGYWYGSWDYFYNSYDNNTYYGPRTPRSSHSGGKEITRASFGEQYENAIAVERSRVKPTTSISTRDTKNVENTQITRQATPENSGNASTSVVTRQQPIKPESNTIADDARNNQVVTPAETRAQQPVNNNNETAANNTSRAVVPQKQVVKTNPVVPNTRSTTGNQRYYAPKNVSPVQPNNALPGKENKVYNSGTTKDFKSPAQERYSKPKNYYSPNFTKPKSSQEYVSPKTESVPAPSKNNNRSGYKRPEAPVREYSAPQRQNYDNNNYSTPRSSESSGRGSYSPSSHGSSSSGSSSGSSRSSSGSSGSSSGSGRGRR